MGKMYEIPKRSVLSIETGKCIECEMVQVTEQQFKNYIDPLARMLADDLVKKIRAEKQEK